MLPDRLGTLHLRILLLLDVVLVTCETRQYVLHLALLRLFVKQLCELLFLSLLLLRTSLLHWKWLHTCDLFDLALELLA